MKDLTFFAKNGVGAFNPPAALVNPKYATHIEKFNSNKIIFESIL